MDVKLESAGNSSEPLFKGMIKQATVAGIPLPILFTVLFITGIIYILTKEM